MSNSNQIALPADRLNIVDAVSLELIDRRAVDLIAASGQAEALRLAALTAAQGSDLFYRVVLHVAAARGLFSTPAKETGKYDADHAKSTLQQVSTESTNSQRKYAGEIIRLAWAAKAAGLDPFAFPSVGAMRVALRPAKEKDVRTEEGGIVAAPDATVDAVPELTVDVDAAVAAAVDAARAESAQAVHDAVQAQAAATDEAQALRERVAVLETDLQAALYGSNKDRAALRSMYPRTVAAAA